MHVLMGYRKMPSFGCKDTWPVGLPNFLLGQCRATAILETPNFKHFCFICLVNILRTVYHIVRANVNKVT
jgi:hypothetical protein